MEHTISVEYRKKHDLKEGDSFTFLDKGDVSFTISPGVPTITKNRSHPFPLPDNLCKSLTFIITSCIVYKVQRTPGWLVNHVIFQDVP